MNINAFGLLVCTEETGKRCMLVKIQQCDSWIGLKAKDWFFFTKKQFPIGDAVTDFEEGNKVLSSRSFTFRYSYKIQPIMDVVRISLEERMRVNAPKGFITASAGDICRIIGRKLADFVYDPKEGRLVPNPDQDKKLLLK